MGDWEPNRQVRKFSEAKWETLHLTSQPQWSGWEFGVLDE